MPETATTPNWIKTAARELACRRVAARRSTVKAANGPVEADQVQQRWQGVQNRWLQNVAG
jgi:hypothetical protein